MTITSKFPSKCKKCSGHINPGEKIEWTKETGPAHITCPQIRQQAAPSSPSRPLVPPSPRRDASPSPCQGTPGPYAGKFKRVEQLVNNLERGEWLTNASNHLQAMPPLDALKEVMVLMQLTQQRVDASYRKKGTDPVALT